jgi:acyl carrier protein
MGLDTVELVILTEQEFGIDILAEDAAQIFTVGELGDYVAQRSLQQHGFSCASQDEIEQRIAQILIREFRIKPAHIHRSARFVADLGLD